MNTPLDKLPPLVCPLTKLPLEVCSAEFLKEINQRIARSELITANGERCSIPLEGVLLRADERVAYPIKKGIPVLVPEAGLTLKS
ncbi:MAG: hypothetical protein RL417_2603 [Pseudomonadota bacterium]|jgi:uncharacterized protein YbaR (Trm112 family)